MTWRDAINDPPTEEGRILVCINGMLFISTAHPHYVNYTDEPVYYMLPCINAAKLGAKGVWKVSPHFRLPEYWMPIPLIPQMEIPNALAQIVATS